MRIFFSWIILAGIFSSSVFSQNSKIGIDPEIPLNYLSMDQWTGRDGLVSNNLTSVNQVSSKFMWITSFNGILRFDGNSFKLFDKKNLPFLNSNGFYRSYEDSKGNILFTSQGSGIIKYTNNQFSQFFTGDSSALSVRCIKENKDGNYWIGTNNNGAFFLKDTVLTKLDFDQFTSLTIMDIEIEDDGKVWFATNGKGILIYDGNGIAKMTVDEGLNSNTVNKLLKASDGRLFVGTADGVFYFSKNVSKKLSLLEDIEVNDLYIDDFENLWIASEQGLFKIHLPTNLFDSFTEEDGLPASQISSLFFDHENSLWISTKKAGLIRFRDGFFKNITTKDHLSSDNVNIVVEHDNAYYIGCDDGLINVYRYNEISKLNLETSYYNVGIRDINFGVEGEILIASYRGLLSVHDGKEQLIDLEQYGLSNDIRRVLRSQENMIWLATRSSGVVKLNSLLDFEQNYTSSNGLKSDYILALEEGKNGDIFIGTHSGGLSVIKRSGEIINYPIEGGKSGILIFNIEILDDNSLWVATNIGIYKFENEMFKKIHLNEDLNAETIFDIIMENGNAWLSSNIGLIKVTLSDLDEFIGGNITSVPGKLFDRYDGMASHECTGATRMTLSSDGKLLIPTLGGVAVLNPNIVKENTQIPEVYITDMNTDFHSRDLSIDKTLSIEPGVMRYEFYFTSLSYIAPPKVRFRYKLIGIDNDWVEAGTEREAIYTNLPKGTYTFRVIASNNDGIWNEEGAMVKFEIQPYFYETIFFYVLVIICLGLIVWGIILWRIHSISRVNTKLLKLNEELDRFVYSASHDLRAPLSSVMGLVEVAKLESSVKGKDECLSRINDSIHKLDGFINDIIDYSRNQRIDVQADKVDLEFEAADVFKELKYLDKDGKIEKRVICYEKRHFMTDGRRVNIILKNLVSNAIRYHDYKKENQFIKVEIKYSTQTAIISISDNGIGIDDKHLENIFKMFYRADESSKGSGLGLYIVKETVDKLGGNIEVSSKINEGTTFTITLPTLKPLS